MSGLELHQQPLATVEERLQEYVELSKLSDDRGYVEVLFDLVFALLEHLFICLLRSVFPTSTEGWAYFSCDNLPKAEFECANLERLSNHHHDVFC
jgi:hypothetical protein